MPVLGSSDSSSVTSVSAAARGGSVEIRQSGSKTTKFVEPESLVVAKVPGVCNSDDTEDDIGVDLSAYLGPAEDDEDDSDTGVDLSAYGDTVEEDEEDGTGLGGDLSAYVDTTEDDDKHEVDVETEPRRIQSRLSAPPNSRESVVGGYRAVSRDTMGSPKSVAVSKTTDDVLADGVLEVYKIISKTPRVVLHLAKGLRKVGDKLSRNAVVSDDDIL